MCHRNKVNEPPHRSDSNQHTDYITILISFYLPSRKVIISDESLQRSLNQDQDQTNKISYLLLFTRTCSYES